MTEKKTQKRMKPVQVSHYEEVVFNDDGSTEIRHISTDDGSFFKPELGRHHDH